MRALYFQYRSVVHFSSMKIDERAHATCGYLQNQS
jgi:hypothetical protein